MERALVTSLTFDCLFYCSLYPYYWCQKLINEKCVHSYLYIIMYLIYKYFE